MSLYEKIKEKLDPIQLFALTAKMDLNEFECQEIEEDKIHEFYLNSDHIVGITTRDHLMIKRLKEENESACFSLKYLKQVLLYFQRNNCTSIRISIKKDAPIIFEDKNKENQVVMICAPKVEEEDDD